jgi:hypothetical protein
MMKPPLREESRYTKDSEVMHSVFGKCRVWEVRGDKVAVIFDKNPIGSLADCWMKIVDGEVRDWDYEPVGDEQ